MTEHSGGWGFYGRKRELDELRRRMFTPTFSTISVIGGRGVGKTALITEAAKSLSGRKLYIYLELPEIDRSKGEPDRLEKMNGVNNALVKQARSLGLSAALPPPPSLSDYACQMIFFSESLESLLRQGTVIVLDEFQNTRELSLVSGVKALIDVLNRERNLAGGKILVAGSHQQKMLTMLFSPTEPMYNRVDLALRLYPLAAPDMLEMAAAQGWLSKPYRFLTAYTTFGGNPQYWRRFSEDLHSGTLLEPADKSDKTWRQNFTIKEIMQYSLNPNEKFLNSAFVNFSDGARIAAIELAQNPRRVRWSKIVQRYGAKSKDATDRVEQGFKILPLHLGVAEFVPESDLFPGSVEKARLTDQAALFELNMEENWAKPSLSDLERDKNFVLAKIREMEGLALERLTAEWLGSFKLFEIVERSTEMHRPDGIRLEIDVIGGTGFTPRDQRHIALCSCKRSSSRHHIQKTHDDFNYYLQLHKTRGSKWDADCIRRFLVSPEWHQSAFRNDGFERLDFVSMAENLGFRIEPWPHSASPEPITENTQLQPADFSQECQPENQPDSDGLEFDI